MTANPDFKAVPVYNDDHLRNGTRLKIRTQLQRNTNRDLRPSQECHFE